MGAPKTDEAGIRQTIRALRNAGYVLDYVDDGEEQVKVTNENEAVDAITAVDSAHLFVKHNDGERASHVWFVLGNSPEEVIADHGISLSHVLDPLMERWS